MRFAQRAEFDGDRAAAEVTFWGKRLEGMTPAEARETMDFEQSRFGFHEWLVFDCPLHGGGTIVERFLARAGGGLRSGERRYLERMRLSHLRPYEVQACGATRDSTSWTCDRERLEGRPAYDFGWMWGQLGLERSD
jgi:hypothetical protein